MPLFLDQGNAPDNAVTLSKCMGKNYQAVVTLSMCISAYLDHFLSILQDKALVLNCVRKVPF